MQCACALTVPTRYLTGQPLNLHNYRFVGTTVNLAAETGRGKYEILKRLAVGGMAEIYLARSVGIEGFEKYVVLKRILPEYAGRPEFVAMFLDEARLAANLHHQNIAQVYDIGTLDGSYFFTMEYLHGVDVRGILRVVAKARSRVPLQYALTVAAGVAAGLDHAHGMRGPDGAPLELVHRDISPSNIVVTHGGAVKIVDFGVARAAQRSAETRTGGVKGKLSYLSPEQCVSEPVDRRSDVFALGIVLWEVTTMRRLFRRTRQEADFTVMKRIVEGEVPAPSTLDAEYPPELEAIVMKALARKPDDRYQTAHDMLVELEAFAAQERMPLSQAALSRYMEELFGRPPEPWLETEQDADDEAPTTEIAKSDVGKIIEQAQALQAAESAISKPSPIASRLPLEPPEPEEDVIGQDSISGWFPIATPTPEPEESAEPSESSTPSLSTSSPSLSTSSPLLPTADGSLSTSPVPRIGRRPWETWVLVLALLAAVAGIAMLLIARYGRDSHGPAPARPAPAATPPSTSAPVVEPIDAPTPAVDPAAAPAVADAGVPAAAADAAAPKAHSPTKPRRRPKRKARSGAKSAGPASEAGLIDKEW